jgi:hypothetical protein
MKRAFFMKPIFPLGARVLLLSESITFEDRRYGAMSRPHREAERG